MLKTSRRCCTYFFNVVMISWAKNYTHIQASKKLYTQISSSILNWYRGNVSVLQLVGKIRSELSSLEGDEMTHISGLFNRDEGAQLSYLPLAFLSTIFFYLFVSKNVERCQAISIGIGKIAEALRRNSDLDPHWISQYSLSCWIWNRYPNTDPAKELQKSCNFENKVNP